MKLETKHLAPYLPYGLMLETSNGIISMDALNDSDKVRYHIAVYADDDYYLSEVKPILRPFSSITREEAVKLLSILITDDIIEEVSIDFINSLDSLVVIESPEAYGKYVVTIDTDRGSIDATYEDYSSVSHSYPVPYEAYEWLFSKHFDIFRLIESNLAINRDEL